MSPTAQELRICRDRVKNEQAERARLEAERDRLREALEKYGQHTTDCTIRQGRGLGCDCGLPELLNNPNPSESDNG